MHWTKEAKLAFKGSLKNKITVVLLSTVVGIPLLMTDVGKLLIGRRLSDIINE